MKDATKRLEWLEAVRELNSAKKVKPLKLITIKIDPDLLAAYKTKCELMGVGYTTRIKELIRKDLTTFGAC